jgi:hypothetical protein
VRAHDDDVGRDGLGPREDGRFDVTVAERRRDLDALPRQLAAPSSAERKDDRAK